MADKSVIEFYATVAQVKTMADGGLRVMLDLPENAIKQAAQLMECKRASVVLNVVTKPKKEKDGEKVVIGDA